MDGPSIANIVLLSALLFLILRGIEKLIGYCVAKVRTRGVTQLGRKTANGLRLPVSR